MPQYLTFSQYFCGETRTAAKMVKESSSLQHFRRAWSGIRAAIFLLLVKEEGKESEAALAASCPLPWLMFAWEQGESLTAPDKFYCLKVTE